MPDMYGSFLSEQAGRVQRAMSFVKRVIPSLFITALPLALTRSIWWQVWHSGVPRAWDGTGHYGIAKIYAQTIFPETLGWVPAYFGGMPFPNFYPPAFYWSVSLLQRTNLFSFLTAFKLVLAISVALLPVAIWLVAYAVSDKDRIVANSAALISVPLLVDARAWAGLPPGLDYYSTFQIGLYTQPLAFLLFAVWYVVYVKLRGARHWSWGLACLLLALAILANFFIAVTACIFVGATLVLDFTNYLAAATDQERKQRRQVLLAHFTSPLVSLSLTLFWVVPMLYSYEYFVTRPYVIPLTQLISPLMWGIYILAGFGVICCLRRKTLVHSYLLASLILLCGIVSGGTVAPHWFPLQPPRFLGTLTVLLTIPAGFAVAALFRFLVGTVNPSGRDGPEVLGPRRIGFAAYAGVILIVIAAIDAFVFIKPPPTDMAFYPSEGSTELNSILEFGQGHREGRYLVEADIAQGAVKFDARAINAYLGAQGNQTLSAVFHEASPNALFFLPTANAFSGFPDSFGISSVLADDLDFAEQPLGRQVRRAQFLGVRYLVIYSPEIKDHLGPYTTARYDFGNWSVFELRGDPTPQFQALPYRPALVVSTFTVKERRGSEYNFIRLVEEQFADGWFDVLLVLSPERKIDKLTNLEQFGALILDTYNFDNEEVAYQRLREYSRSRCLILLSSEANLFKRIRATRAEFPLAEFIDRQVIVENDEPLGANEPTFHYGSTSIRKEWHLVRSVLERRQVPVEANGVHGEVNYNEIRLNTTTASPENFVPIMISNSYHPNWQRADRGAIYAVTPFNMLTFVNQPVRLVYGRRKLDDVGLWISGSLFLFLVLGTCYRIRWRRRLSNDEVIVSPKSSEPVLG